MVRVIAVLALSVFFSGRALAQLPSGWTDADIGSPPVAGSATYSSGTFTVNGDGVIGGTADKLNFCYQAFTGDFVFIARMTSDPNGVAGLIMRESLAANAREEMVYSPNTSGSAWIYWRLTTGGTGSLVAGPTEGYPVWLKLQRTGGYIYKYCSTDGVTWLPLYGEDEILSGLASTVYVGMASSRNSTTALNTATFDNVSLQAASTVPLLPGYLRTTWIGNTLGQGGNYSMFQIEVLGMYVGPDGTCYTNSLGADLTRTWGVYKNGACTGFIPGSQAGGYAITGDSSYLYIAQNINSSGPPSGTNWYTVRRVNISTWASAPFTGGTGPYGDMLEIGAQSSSALTTAGNVLGLACNASAGTLYASDTLNGKIDLISTSSMTISSAWTLPSGYAPMGLCWDGTDGLLWAIVENTSTGADQVWAYNGAGVQQTALTITGASGPISLSYYSGKLYVADNGPDQNIKVYTSITTAPTLSTTYGTTGGEFSGSGATIGTTGALRFNGLSSIGIDSSGNLYVGYDGFGPGNDTASGSYRGDFGDHLESYSLSTSALNWQLQSLEFVDSINIDPNNEASAYGNYMHYSVNWNNTTPGTEWSLVGNTLNYIKYPGDFRWNNSATSSALTQVIYISGQRFLTLGDGYHLEFYRFNSSTDGEGAIPCAEFNVATSDPGHTGLAIWTDANGDGVRQLSEVTYLGGYINPMFGDYIDPNGTIWSIDGSGTTIEKFPCAGLNSVGAPEYSPTTKTTIQLSSLSTTDKFTQACRLSYDQPNDTMYIMGFTTNYPSPGSNSGNGTVVEAFNHWSTTPTLAWESVLPTTYSGSAYSSQVPQAMTTAGSYVFVQYQQNYRASVLLKSTGALVGTLHPDPNVVGDMDPIWTDTPHAINAFKRSNGEYIITVEDDIFNKSIMYRWLPWTDVDIGTVGIAGSSSYNQTTGTFTIVGSGDGITNGATNDAFHFTYVPMTGNFTLSCQLNSMVSTDANSRAGIVVRNDMTTSSEYCAGLGTTTSGDRVGGFWRVTTGGSPTGNDPAGYPPIWFRVVRSGNTFTAYHSSDGMTWSSYGSQTIAMNSTVYVGMMSCSSTTTQGTATISNVTLTSP